ncbi:hypothetical protein QJS10_CPB21g00726 [Acorus calamus]|uniref:Uncharacterized protein n=1 Tax=Acorus calamus TaxID=4465 RepID=A0AAV9C3X5_ACOCL|nr:hypothetical protein QJS10_CPB21g00726 [Acorus calamus]
MAAFQISTNLPVINTFCVGPSNKRSCSGIKSVSPTCSSLSSGFLSRNGSKIGSFGAGVAFLGGKDLILRGEKGRRGCFVVVRANQGFGFNGGGGGGGRDNNTTARVIGNLALAIGLTYLSMTGQLGWVLDAIVSIWIIAVLVPIVGFGAFLWYAGREIIQSSCPNCGNDFQIFRSSLKDGVQLCPFCSQPFSVQGSEFVRESPTFSSKQSTGFRQAFNGFSPRSEKGKTSSTAVVDIEAEVKDID